MTAVTARLLIAPRRDAGPGECEDAGAVDPGGGRFAVADGASESAHAGVWARLLVEAFAAGGEWPGWVEAARMRWARAVERPADAGPVPWFLEGRDERGAFATFLGLRLDGDRWHALAVGDACLFVVREGRPHVAFPLTHSAEFGNAPALIGSRAAQAVSSVRAAEAWGDVRPGDRYWLMTDALARWYLERAEAGERPWLLVEQLADGSEEEFLAWIAFSRGVRRLRDDDCALLALLM